MIRFEYSYSSGVNTLSLILFGSIQYSLSSLNKFMVRMRNTAVSIKAAYISRVPKKKIENSVMRRIILFRRKLSVLLLMSITRWREPMLKRIIAIPAIYLLWLLVITTLSTHFLIAEYTT